MAVPAPVDAPCATAPDMWDAMAPAPIRHKARQICRRCPFLDECLDYTWWLIDQGNTPTGVIQTIVAWPVIAPPKAKARERLLRAVDSAIAVA